MASFECAADVKRIDLLNLAETIRNLESQGIEELHFDMADGQFIPEFGFSTALIQAVKEFTELPCHAHLLVANPEASLPTILATGVDIVTLHVETSVHIHRALSQIRDSGKKVGLALSPTTPLTKVNYCLPLIDRLVILGADPVTPGKAMQRATFERVRILNENIRYREHAIEIDIDGPLPIEDAARCLRFGAKRLIVSPEDVSDLGGDNAESLEYYKESIATASHTV